MLDWCLVKLPRNCWFSLYIFLQWFKQYFTWLFLFYFGPGKWLLTNVKQVSKLRDRSSSFCVVALVSFSTRFVFFFITFDGSSHSSGIELLEVNQFKVFKLSWSLNCEVSPCLSFPQKFSASLKLIFVYFHLDSLEFIMKMKF